MQIRRKRAVPAARGRARPCARMETGAFVRDTGNYSLAMLNVRVRSRKTVA